MPNPYLQKVRQRKLIYFGLVLVLFFVSLLHRRHLVEPSALRLYLRETARGETDLGSSAVSLMLSGSKAITSTVLWTIAQKRQERHEYNELEMLVTSIGKLQPHFVTPWVFQGWNLAFNVSVEWDRPQDKYYYISKGFKLLAEGERRHEGTGDKATADAGAPRFPGNPDMRFQLGNFYMLKIGTSDEKNFMRSLLEASCIPPERRDPNRYWTTIDRVRTVKASELESLCRDYPRFVRRLREKLGLTSEKQIVAFLESTLDLPSRFEKYTGPWDQVETKILADYRQQFPILPSPKAARLAGPGEEGWPNPDSRELTTQESFDIYFVARTWMQYAQRPLPPPVASLRQLKVDPIEHRIPKQPSIYIFRNYPGLTQIFMAENLQGDGWFDTEGWIISDWFERTTGDLRIGTSDIFDSRSVWLKAGAALADFGFKNGLLLDESTHQFLQTRAARFAQKWGVRPGSKISVPVRQQDDDFLAWELLQHSGNYRQLTNFDYNMALCDWAQDRETILANKYFFQGERLRRFERLPEQALELYQKAVPLFLESVVRHPAYYLLSSEQEDTYENELKYIKLVQQEKAGLMRNILMGLWDLGPWPSLRLHEQLPPSEKIRILPIKTARGPFSSTVYYNGPNAEALQEAIWKIVTLPAGVQPMLGFPGQHKLLLVTRSQAGVPPSAGWQAIVPADVVSQVRMRLRLDR